MNHLDPLIVLHGGKPYWHFRIFGGYVSGRVDFPLDGGEPLAQGFGRPGSKPDQKQIRSARSWVRKHRRRSRELLSLPIDWSEPLYARYGAWSGPSRTFLREDTEEPGLYAPGSQHERRWEVGVSVLHVRPTGSDWEPQRPSQRHALYRTPDDYLESFRGRKLFIVQGDRIEVGEHYDEVTDEVWPIWATGADGEPLLEPDSIRVVARLGRGQRATAEIPLPTNDYGNIDVSSGVPPGLAYVEGQRLTVTCRSLGIECAPAMTGWVKGRGGWKPDLTGVVVHEKDEATLRAAIERRNQRRRTPEQKAAAKRRRQAKDAAVFVAQVVARFPGMPQGEAASVASRATEIGSGRVGRSGSAKDPVLAAVIAHVRHRHTDYELDLEAGVERHEARRMAGEQIAAILDQWRGEPP